MTGFKQDSPQLLVLLQKGSAVGTETKIPRADYFSVSGSITPGFPPHGQLLTARRQVDVAQWWQMPWLQSWTHTTHTLLFYWANTLTATTCRAQILPCAEEMRRKQTTLPNPGFYWAFIKNEFIIRVLYKTLCSWSQNTSNVFFMKPVCASFALY